MRRLLSAFIVTALLIVGGLFIPIAEYTTQNGVCSTEHPATVHLSYLKGDRINRIIDNDQPAKLAPTAECAPQARYVLYLL